MDTEDYINLFDDLDDHDQTENFINKNKRPQRFPERHFKYVRQANAEFLNGQDDSRRNFNFTYSAARFEEWWLLESLGDFYEHKWITDVLRRLKGGKEASVYLCRSGPAIDAPLVAAKVYRPRALRNLKNDGEYRTGRVDLDENGNAIVKEGDLHAMAKRTQYGEELRHQSWIAYEFQTLEILHQAGADVPRPYAMEKNAILMEYIGDMDLAAPTLNSVSLEREEVKPLFERVLRDIDLLLANRRIHGDLSAYNILYWEGDITMIDFPQVVQPDSNPAAWSIFLRDITRICQYFASQGLRRDPRRLAADLWTSHGHRIMREVHPSQLDPDDPEDRKIWEKQKAGS
ncbi:MAG TPA: RIO1 family regulatory kinase/ATPase [Anaerolineales bacterium]|nr:RIO1 family regulatory kinase/ATPase [Anaerolineales bacterium]